MFDPALPKFRRHVFFISGFDPRGAAFMHSNCVREAAKWSTITGHAIETSSRERDSSRISHNWHIYARFPERVVETQFSFLSWDDIIRAYWPKNEAATALQTFMLLLRSIISGVFGRAFRESWPFAVTMTTASGWVLIPITALLLFCLALVIYLVLPLGIGWTAALIVVSAAFWLLWWGWRNMERTKPGWTGRIGLFAHAFALGKVGRLDSRLNTFVEKIILTVQQDERDEILIVGHSFGTALATLVAARVLAMRPELGAISGKLTLVTLGQMQSLVVSVPEAQWFRAELALLAESRHFTWLDFSAPPDGACFALVNVLDFLPKPPLQNIPRLLNAQFHKTFSAETIEHARRHRMEMHFLYLKSPDQPQYDSNIYDFVMLIAGPLSAKQRYKHRKSGEPFFRKGTKK